jgi:hypothetical protein
MLQTNLYGFVIGARAEKVIAALGFDSIDGLCIIIAGASF